MFQRRTERERPTEIPTTSPTGPEDFFQPGTDYRLNRDYPGHVLTHFRCVAVDRHPGTHDWFAFGWWAQGITQPREPRGMDTYEWGRGWTVVRRLVPPTPADIARGLS